MSYWDDDINKAQLHTKIKISINQELFKNGDYWNIWYNPIRFPWYTEIDVYDFIIPTDKQNLIVEDVLVFDEKHYIYLKHTNYYEAKKRLDRKNKLQKVNHELC